MREVRYACLLQKRRATYEPDDHSDHETTEVQTEVERMRMEMNLGDLLSEEEHQAYLASSVEMFIRAYRVGG